LYFFRSVVREEKQKRGPIEEDWPFNRITDLRGILPVQSFMLPPRIIVRVGYVAMY
jgi:hypothetical protein